MALEDYARKRKFAKTPEPPPAPPAPAAAGNFFCVQRHFARRLHYDFRLEVGGVLKSWAVPHGPSLDPATKQLAVMVEDHPFDYGTFEGNIPAGNYGAGSVMLWDTGTYELLGDKTAEEQIERGDLKFRLQGEKLAGEFAIVRMKNRGKGNEWLLLKKKDQAIQPGYDIENFAESVSTGRTQEEIAQDMPPRKKRRGKSIDLSEVPGAIEAAMPRNVSPMLAQISEKLPPGQGWVYEIKWDGIRAICFLEDGKTRMVSRKALAMDRQYPELGVLPQCVNAKTAVLDGEIAALDENGRPSFARIQPRIMAVDPNAVAHLSRSRPVTFLLFDLLYLNGYDLCRTPLVERKKLLQSILKPNDSIRFSEHFETDGAALLEAVRAQGLEGVIAKRADSTYQPKRSRDWLKIKVVQEGDFIICGYTKGERDFFGALVLGFFDKKKLAWAGNVGTGFDRKLMEAIFHKLQPLEMPKSPFPAKIAIPQEVTWLRPEVVCTVRYQLITEDRRLRAPVFVGLRPDVAAEDCVLDGPEETPPAREPLLTGTSDEANLTIDRQKLKLTHLNKIFYPKEGYTKRDLLNYYDAVADLLLPHLKGRPLSLRRYPNGIAEEAFFQKRADKGFPDWIHTEMIPEKKGDEPRPMAICNDRATLLYLTHLGCIDENPWMSRLGALDQPDFMLIDLDPYECTYDQIVEAAQLVRRKLEQMGLASYPKTTGGDGMHLYVPIEPVYSYEQVRTFAEIVSRIVIAERADLFTTPRAVGKRQRGRVYFDHLQIGRGKTISAPYVLRAYPGAPVATPLEWSEVKPGLLPSQFHIRNAIDRFSQTGDLFAPVLTNRQRLEPAMRKLEALIK
jgi:bifunctional non-homologous end joining protein LigD